MEKHEFLSFLSCDNEFTRGQRVCKELSVDFQTLLKLSPINFWKTVELNKYLHLSLESFLRHSQRPYDFLDVTAQGNVTMQSSIGKLLSHRIFLVLVRIATTVEENKGAPPREKRLQIIRNTGVLSLPILLDACAIYGTTNGDLLKQMIRHLFQSQPLLLKDLLKMGPVLAQNLTEVGLRCKEAVDAEGMGAAVASSSSSSAQMEEHLDVEALLAIRDAVDYMRDTCQTLSSFTEIYSEGAAVLIAGGEDLVDPLASIYDDLLPDVLNRIEQIRENAHNALWISEVVESIEKKCRHIELVLLLFVGSLINNGYFTDVQGLVAALQGVNCNVPVLKEPTVRGEVLMSSMMNISQPDHSLRRHGTALLMQAVNNRFGLDQLAADASEKGYLYLDIQQLDYLLAILGSTRSLTSLRQSASSASQQNGLPQSSKKSKSKEKAMDEMDRALLNSQIQQIRDIFPDYGEGFVECCLEVYNHNPEQVIHHIFENSLAPQLKALDTGLKVKPQKEEFPQLGKRSDNVLAQPTQKSFASTIWGQKDNQQLQQQPKKKTVSKSVARTMDLQNYDDKDAIRRHAEVAVLQWEQEREYDDEYDDTFDDAVDAGLDVSADVQGDKPESNGLRLNTNQQAGSSSGGKPKKMWILDGKIYNYKKEGATEVKYKDESNKQLAAEVAGRDHIRGMGPGGNKAAIAQQQEYQQSMQSGSNNQKNNSNNNQDSGGGQGRGRGQPNYARKDKNKHAVANHHRKDRAMKKMSGGM